MCGKEGLEKVLSLPPTPPGNNFLDKSQLLIQEDIFPLELYCCRGCGHIQLGHVVDPKILYQDDYKYVSSTGASFVRHLEDFAKFVCKFYQPDSNALIVDIGSNDGACLRQFKNLGFNNILGVDPAEQIAAQASASGVNTVCDFFGLEVAKRLRAEHGPAKIITSHNAFAHIDNLSDVIDGVNHWLAEDGLFFIEVGYLMDVYENLWFDTIYHEHLDFHTVGPFKILLEHAGFHLIDAKRVSPQGGSIRLTAQKIGGSYTQNMSVNSLIQQEIEKGLYQPETFKEFANGLNRLRSELVPLIAGLKESGYKIAGFGAPTKSTTFLTYFNLGLNEIDFIADDNPLKYGKYTPLTHIPVLSSNEIYRQKPDFVLILAWNFADIIMENHSQYLLDGGRFIVPMPVPRIISA
jgi:hypothetical protein